MNEGPDDSSSSQRDVVLVEQSASAPEPLPELIRASGGAAKFAWEEFLYGRLRNSGTRRVYRRAVGRFLAWCEQQGTELVRVAPAHVGRYLDDLPVAPATKKQHLAALRHFFDNQQVHHGVVLNPAASVRGPRHSARVGKTPAFDERQVRTLLESIDTSHVVGVRDKTLLMVLAYTAARAGAVAKLRTMDYATDGRSWHFEFGEKGGKRHDVPAHRRAEGYIDAYIAAAGIASDKKSPLFRTLDRQKRLTERRLQRREVLAMVKRRASEADLPADICCHTFRATGITAYLENGGTIEHAQRIAAHESPRTTKLYDRTGDAVSLEEIDRLRI